MAIIDSIRSRIIRLFGKPALTQRARASYGSVDFPGTSDNDDPSLAEYATNGEGLALYDRLMRQVPRVAGLFKLRIDAALALPQTWIAGDPNDPESLDLRDQYEDAWNAIPDRRAAERNLMMAIAKGITFAELVYYAHETTPVASPERQRLGDTLTPTAATLIVPRLIDDRSEFYYFDKDGNLFRRANGTLKDTPVDRRQVIVIRYGSAQMYGRGEMSDFATDMWKFIEIDKMGLKALAKQGYKLMKIRVPELADAGRVADYVHAVSRFYPNYIVEPTGDRFETEIVPDSDVAFIGEDQLKRMDWHIDSMSIGVLGVSFSNGDTGSYARDAVRERLAFDKTGSDAELRDAIAKQWRDLVAEVNHPNVPKAKLPIPYTDAKPTEDLDSWMKNLQIAVQLGFPASTQQISMKQGFQIATDEKDKLTQTKKDTVLEHILAREQAKQIAAPATPPAPAQPPTPSLTEQGVAVMSDEGDIRFTPWQRVQEFLLREPEGEN